jgi:hypothetical protein
MSGSVIPVPWLIYVTAEAGTALVMWCSVALHYWRSVVRQLMRFLVAAGSRLAVSVTPWKMCSALHWHNCTLWQRSLFYAEGVLVGVGLMLVCAALWFGGAGLLGLPCIHSFVITALGGACAWL